MSNFAFLREIWPDVLADCSRAESYLVSDPRAACVYARRAVEQLVRHLYDVMALRVPYQDDLAARINDAAFGARVGRPLVTKMNLVRKVGNTAVHETKPVRPDVSRAVVTELHHVVVWAAFHHSPHPSRVPLTTAFDPALAAQAAPLSRAELVKLAERFRAQDEAHARALAAKDDLLARHESEIAALREQIAAAQAATSRTDDRDYSEADTRRLFIDVLLAEAGWPLTDDRDREYPVTGMPNEQGTGYVDYVLWGADGLPLAVVEAKRTTKSPELGRRQAELYADRLEAEFGRRPVVFCSNGYEHWLWDDAAGYPPREVQGFYTRDELELMVRRRHSRLPLSTTPIDAGIAGRFYQVRAVKAVGDAFERKQRDALLVMATGSGKTRTVIALVDQLMKAGWVKRVLFLADRTALVTQTVNAFKTHLPGVTTVNLVTDKATDGRVYVSTYPTMLNLVDEVEDGARRFGPGYFDLVVVDEAHRSVYARYGAIFDWFDSLLVGLTATPKDEVDRNTYRLFHLEDGVPTDAYSLGEAVADTYLVPPKSVAVTTRFLRQGIRYDDLTDDEKDEWDALDWGEDDPPDEIGSEELNRFLFNIDTVDNVIATLMLEGYKVAGGDRLGKTIVFAKNQRHAEFVQQRFDLTYPEHSGRFARVVTHAAPYAQTLIDDFSQPDKAPHIAISVDMLDTGIDVPEVVNLVFFKAVRSKTKFWQMIGRGTRLRPDLFGPGADKQDFLVLDFCGNLEFFSQDLPGREGSTQRSLSQRLFEARVGLVKALDPAGDAQDVRDAAADALHEFVTGLNVDNVLVRPHRRHVESWGRREVWRALTGEQATEVVEHLAGLPSAAQQGDEHAKRFDLLVLRRQLAQTEGDTLTAERLRETLQAIATALLDKRAIPSVAQQLELLDALAGDAWWVDVSLSELEVARVRVRDLVRFVDRTPRSPVYTDFADPVLGPGDQVVLPPTLPGTDLARFRTKVTAYLREHEDHVALQRLRRNRQLTPDDLAALQDLLVASGAGRPEDIEHAAERAEGLGLFIRSLVGLDRTAVTEAFADYLDGNRFTVDQIRFVNLIVDELTANGVMHPKRLFESPYTDGVRADLLFPDSDVDVIVGMLHDVRRRALAEGA